MVAKSKLGWIPPEKRSYSVNKLHDRIMQDTKVMGSAGYQIKDTGAGKKQLLWKCVEAVSGRPIEVNNQGIGDCVSHGWAKALEIVSAADIVARGEAEEYRGTFATEWLYGTGRVLVGGGRLGNSDGSLGSWQAKAVKEHGTLVRAKFGNHDLTNYDPKRAKSWGYRGLPANELEPTADEHPAGETALVTTYEQARDSIFNGYAVAVCSNQGFTNTRDSQGFAQPKGNWAHCMVFIAMDDESGRPGLLCLNSWGTSWIRGPKRHDQPEGSFWVDAEVAERMLRGQDSFAPSSYRGYPSRKIDYTLHSLAA